MSEDSGNESFSVRNIIKKLNENTSPERINTKKRVSPIKNVDLKPISKKATNANFFDYQGIGFSNDISQQHLNTLERQLASTTAELNKISQKAALIDIYRTNMESTQHAFVNLRSTCEEREKIFKVAIDEKDEELSTLRDVLKNHVVIKKSNWESLLRTLKHKGDTLQEGIVERDKKIDHYKSKFSADEKVEVALRGELRNLRTQNNTLNMTLFELKGLLEERGISLSQTRQVAHKALSEHNKQVSDCMEKVYTLENEIKKLRDENTTLRASNSRILTESNMFLDSSCKNEAELDVKRTEVQRLHEVCIQLRKEHQESTVDKESLIKQVNLLKVNLDNEKDQNLQLSIQLAEVTGLIQEYKERTNTVLDELHNIDKEKTILANTLQSVMKQFTSSKLSNSSQQIRVQSPVPILSVNGTEKNDNSHRNDISEVIIHPAKSTNLSSFGTYISPRAMIDDHTSRSGCVDAHMSPREQENYFEPILTENLFAAVTVDSQPILKISSPTQHQKISNSHKHDDQFPNITNKKPEVPELNWDEEIRKVKESLERRVSEFSISCDLSETSNVF